jgi:hypothetical protein
MYVNILGLPSNGTYLIVGSQISHQPTFVTYGMCRMHVLFTP